MASADTITKTLLMLDGDARPMTSQSVRGNAETPGSFDSSRVMMTIVLELLTPSPFSIISPPIIGDDVSWAANVPRRHPV